MSLRQALEWAKQRLQPSPTARLDALVLLEFACGHERAWLLARQDEELASQIATKFSQLVEQRTMSEPVAYITGSKEFYGLDLKITPDVLIPRPETESLVELAIQLTPKSGRLCDVGTGSGAIAIAIAKNRPDLDIIAVDISSAALRIARGNTDHHNVDDRVIVAKSDLLTATKGSFDTIIANLPYLPSSYSGSAKPLQGKTLQDGSAGLGWEPRAALDGGVDGLEVYRRFFSQAPMHLSSGGYIIIEAETSQHEELVKIAATASLTIAEQRGLVLAFRMSQK